MMRNRLYLCFCQLLVLPTQLVVQMCYDGHFKCNRLLTQENEIKIRPLD